jgi:uncharacterized membrane protein
MGGALDFIKTTVIGGLLVIVPVVAVLGFAAKMIATLLATLQPIASRLPGGPIVRDLASLVLVIALCFLAGLIARTTLGAGLRRAADRWLERVPGFALVRSLVRRVAGEEEGTRFQVALAEIEDALVPAFLIEEHDDGSYTVFVPAVPTPMAGAIYILPRERVHPVDVPFATAIQCFTRWGEGTGELLRAMRRAESTGSPA